MISFLVPTRGRSNLVVNFLNSLVNFSSDIKNIEVILYIDEDDIGSQAIEHEVVNLIKIIGPALSMGSYNLECFKKAQGTILILCNDDVLIRTKNWDKKIQRLHAVLDDQIYLAYPNDLFKGEKLCAFPILSRKTCELLVHPFPKEYVGSFIDYHLLDIFKRLEVMGEKRIFYLDDVVFEHMHYRAGKSEIDKTYSSRSRFGDDRNFLSLEGVRKKSAETLFCSIKNSKLVIDNSVIAANSVVPTNLILLIFHITRKFLYNSELPFKWRFFLWYWFVGRTLAERGWLRPFISP